MFQPGLTVFFERLHRFRGFGGPAEEFGLRDSQSPLWSPVAMRIAHGVGREDNWASRFGFVVCGLVLGLPQVNLGTLSPGESKSWEWVIKGKKKIEISPTHPRSFVNSLTIYPQEIR